MDISELIKITDKEALMFLGLVNINPNYQIAWYRYKNKDYRWESINGKAYWRRI